MKGYRVVFTLLAFSAFFPLSAQGQRTFVSAQHGSDANPCSVTLPCRTFGAAIAAVPAGGEVLVLDSGGYGGATITQAVTIEAPAGIYAGIHVATDAITINAGAGDAVVLRGLTLNGGAGTGDAIVANTVGSLRVESCVISQWTNAGIHLSTAAKLFVDNTNITGCLFGVQVDNGAGTSQIHIDHCHFDGNNGSGYIAKTAAPGGSTAVATNSSSSNNGGDGWVCGSGSSGTDNLNLEFCDGSGNGAYGLVNNSSNALSVSVYSNCVLSNNVINGASRLASGPVASRSNSTLTGNGSGPTSGTITLISGQ
jgi:hypothetical protein